MNEQPTNTAFTTCPNCQSSNNNEAKYCNHCGQKIPRGMPRLWDLLGDFISSLINLDSKFFKSGRDIFIPAKLTKNFFRGIRGKYYPPFRLLFFSSVFFFAILGLTDFNTGLQEGLSNGGLGKVKERIQAVQQIDSAQSKVLDRLPPDYHSIANTTFDTIRQVLSPLDRDSINISLLAKKNWKIAEKDIALLTSKELMEKYKIEYFWDKLIVKQTIKTIQQPDKFVLYLIGNTIWLLAILIPLLAIVMKLFYIRRKRYYIEHFVFLLHQHSFIFISLSLALIIGYLTDEDVIVYITLGIFPIYLFISMKRYFQQGYFKTFVKLILISFSYLFLGLLVLAGVTIISLAVF